MWRPGLWPPPACTVVETSRVHDDRGAGRLVTLVKLELEGEGTQVAQREQAEDGPSLNRCAPGLWRPVSPTFYSDSNLTNTDMQFHLPRDTPQRISTEYHPAVTASSFCKSARLRVRQRF